MIFQPGKIARLFVLMLFGLFTTVAMAQPKKYVIIDQDASGPATTDTNSILVFLQSPDVKVLGVTVVSGDEWRDEEVAHTLRLLELVGRTDVPVVPGIVFPFLQTQRIAQEREKRYGLMEWMGAFGPGVYSENINSGTHGPYVVPKLPEGNPTTKPLNEDAPHFLIRMVHKYPHQVTIYAGGPLMNIATAIILDPHFADLAKELVVMGGAINPHTSNSEPIESRPRSEFNFWFDPEAASIVFHAPWPKITVAPFGISFHISLTKAMLEKLSQTHTPAAQYIARYTRQPGDLMWDEITAAAWLDPSLVAHERDIYMDVSVDKGISYGDTLIWSDRDKPPDVSLDKVHVEMSVDGPKFQQMFMHLMSLPTPDASNPQIWSQPAQAPK